MNDTHHSGFACFVGRPNAGKSTLTNALVGAKVAIASSKPQTTRHVVRGIVTRPDGQLVLIDTPGLDEVAGDERERLARQLANTADLILFVIAGDITRVEFEALAQLREASKPILLVFNKIDQFPTVDRQASIRRWLMSDYES